MTRNVPVLASTFWLMALGGCAGPSIHIAPVPTLRVMTYNIQYGGGNLDSIAAVIRRSDADVIALQEVDVHWSERSAWVDQADSLAKLLGMQARFAPIYDLPGTDSTKPRRQFGVAFLTKFPVVYLMNYPITRLSTQTTNPVAAPSPGFLEIMIDFQGKRLHLYNTHLDYRSDPRVREQQVAEMLRLIESVPEAITVLFGDMNATPDAAELQPLFRHLNDTWPSSLGAGLTYPARDPVKRIDYVLISRHFSARDQAVLPTLASDHRPVVMNLVLR